MQGMMEKGGMKEGERELNDRGQKHRDADMDFCFAGTACSLSPPPPPPLVQSKQDGQTTVPTSEWRREGAGDGDKDEGGM